MNSDTENPENLDYEAEGASVLEVHEAVQREKEEPTTPGIEPAGRWVTILCAIVVALGGGFLFSNSNGFSDSPYVTDYYTPDPRPDLGGGAEVVEQLTWIEDWMKDGKKVYGNCASCHQADGLGVPGQFPPLVDSEWVNGGTKRIAAIILNGVQGPMTVAGQKYGAQAMQPWNSLSDEGIAQVMTYVRRTFGELPEGDDGIVTTEMVEAARSEFSGRTSQWTEPELLGIPEDAMLPGAEVDPLTGQPMP